MGFLVNSYRFVAPTTVYTDVDELKAYYKFDEASGNLINQATAVGSSDSLGTAADGVGSGGRTYGESGIIDDSILFNGTNGYFTISTDPSIFNFMQGAGSTFSINVWYKKPSVGADLGMFFGQNQGSGTDAQERGCALFTNSVTSITCYLSTGETNYYVNGSVANTIVNDTNWNMLTITYDEDGGSNNFKVYKNGAFIGAMTGSTTVSANTPEWNARIGVDGDANQNFTNGSFDEWSIWARVLSADDITELYNSGEAAAIDG